MSPPLIYRAQVRDDIDNVYARYEGERVGLGERFLSALGALLDDIRQNPEMYGVVFRDVRAVRGNAVSPRRLLPDYDLKELN